MSTGESGDDLVVILYHFLSAYPWETVERAVSMLGEDRARGVMENRDRLARKLDLLGWKEHTGEIPRGFEWQQIGDRVFIRDPSLAASDPSRVTVRGSKKDSGHRKTDTSVKKVADLKCPACGGEIFKEGICPGCEDGRRGFKVRLLCGECDYTLAL